MKLDLTDEEAATLIRELTDITFSARYPLSPRIKTLRAILAKLRGEPVREPLPPRSNTSRQARVDTGDAASGHVEACTGKSGRFLAPDDAIDIRS
jgi:hypothetical protein